MKCYRSGCMGCIRSWRLSFSVWRIRWDRLAFLVEGTWRCSGSGGDGVYEYSYWMKREEIQVRRGPTRHGYSNKERDSFRDPFCAAMHTHGYYYPGFPTSIIAPAFIYKNRSFFTHLSRHFLIPFYHQTLFKGFSDQPKLDVLSMHPYIPAWPVSLPARHLSS